MSKENCERVVDIVRKRNPGWNIQLVNDHGKLYLSGTARDNVLDVRVVEEKQVIFNSVHVQVQWMLKKLEERILL